MTTPKSRRTRTLVYEAICRLDGQDPGELFGPSDIAANLRDTNVAPKATTSLVCTHLKGLIDEGLVERVSLGKKRGLYRLLHELPPSREEEE